MSDGLIRRVTVKCPAIGMDGNHTHVRNAVLIAGVDDLTAMRLGRKVLKKWAREYSDAGARMRVQMILPYCWEFAIDKLLPPCENAE